MTPMAAMSSAARERTEESSFSKFEPWIDFLLPLLVLYVLVVSCVVVSPKKEIWVDEVYSYSLVANPSFSHALSALHGSADGGMPLYYLLANPWAHIFGAGLLALRLFTSLNIASGMFVLWRVLRARYSAIAAAISILAVGLNSRLLLYQDAELRYYGTFFLCAALVLWTHLRLSGAENAGCRLWLPVWAAHVLLIYSHPFGILYSAAALLGVIVVKRDWRSGKLVLLLASSWLTLLPWLPVIRRVQDIGHPHNWVERPALVDVLASYSVPLPCALLTVLVVAAVAMIPPARGFAAPKGKDDTTLLAQSAMFVLVPAAVALVSWVAMPLFVERYFLPSRLGMVVLGARVAESALHRVDFKPIRQAAIAALLVVLLALPVASAISRPKDNLFHAMMRVLGTSTPVLVDNLNILLPLDYYDTPRLRPYYYVLDWDSALRSSSLHATVQAKIAMRRREQHYHQGRILETNDALCSFGRFIVLHDAGMAWFHDRVEQNPAFISEQMGRGAAAPVSLSIWLVTRIGVPKECLAR